MANIYDYINKYGNRSYTIEPFNDIDNLVYSSLAYIDFKDIVSDNEEYILLQDAASKFLMTYSYKEFSKYGIAFREAYKLLEVIQDKDRYKDNRLSRYVYIGDKENQFSALCINVKNKFTYISFEGTDHLISGWKEDFALSYEYPVNCQKYAIKYINKAITWKDLNVIIGGHSKGGNLAMVAAMNLNFWKWLRVKKVYNNDGPGFRKKEFESLEYKKMETKLKWIIPNYSFFGLMLNHTDNYIVVESSRKDIISHAMYTWQVKDNQLVTTSLSRLSKNLDKSVKTWLKNHNDDERKKLINSFFDAVDKAGISNTMDARSLRNIINLIKSMYGLDKETKNLLIDLIEYNLMYCIKNL